MKRLLAPSAPDPLSLRSWRERLLSGTLLAVLLLSTPLAVQGIVSYVQHGLVALALFTGLYYGAVLGLLLARRMNHVARASAALALFFLAGARVYAMSGMAGSGRIYIVFTVVLAAMLLGRRAVALVLAANTLLVVGTMLAIDGGIVAVAEPPSPTAGIAVVVVAGVIGVLILSLIDRLIASVRTTEQALAERERVNASLEELVAERTRQLHEAADALRHSEVKYKTLFQALPAGVSITDHRGNILESNAALERLMGSSAVRRGRPLGSLELPVFRPDGTLMPPDEFPAAQVLGEREPVADVEMGVVRQDRSVIWLNATAAPLPLEGYGAAIVYTDITARRRAEEALRERESMIRTIGDNLPGGLIYQAVREPSGTLQIAYISASVEQLTGLTQEQVYAEPEQVWELLHPGDVAQSLAADLADAALLAQADVERGIVRPDGTRGWLRVRSLPQRRVDGSVMWYGFALDVTAQKEDAEALARQLRYAEALARCSQILLSDAAVERDLRPPLDAALEVLREAVGAHYLYILQPGKPPALDGQVVLLAEALGPGQPPSSVPTADEVADAPPELMEAMRQGRPFAGPVAGRFPDSPRFQQAFDRHGVQSMLMIPLMPDGVSWGLLGASDCETPREWDPATVQLLRTAGEMIATFERGSAATRAQAVAEARQRALLDALPDLMFVARRDGTLIDYHAPRVEELHIPPQVFLGRRVGEVMPAQVGVGATDAIARAADGGVVVFEYSLPFKGEDRQFEARVVAITGDELLIVVRDITERRRAADALLRAKEAAEDADRTKTTFLAHVSHEIRTPLTAIIGMSYLLQDSDLPAREREYVEMISTAGDTLLGIINRILDLSKIDAGKLALEAQPFDLSACLRDALDMVSHDAERKELALLLRIGEHVPRMVVGDSVRLQQVIVNLLANAVKFTHRGSVSLEASAQPRGGGQYDVTVVIHDTGIGIPPDQLQRIFEPFEQVDNATTRRYGGTGLGLAISRQIVEMMGGQLMVASEPGSGSQFVLSLPLPASDAALIGGAGASDAAGAAALRVLVAEDNPINQQVLVRMLERMGYQVDVASNGRAALDAVVQRPYDVVLMDIQMPELDGEEATRQIRLLRDRVAQPCIVALTASALLGDRERYLAAGMNEYLSKPVQYDQLRMVLERIAAGEGQHAPAAEPAQHTPASDDLVDWQTVERLLESMGEQRAAAATLVVELFQREIPPQIEALSSAFAAGDRPRAMAAAHTLRGGSRQLGGAALAAACAAIERALAGGEEIRISHEDLRRTYEQTLAALSQRYRAELAL